MKSETFVLTERYPDCRMTSYVHELSGELNVPPRRAIIICPGGAYLFLTDREAEPVALQYFAAGLNVYVLNYSVGEKAANDAPMIEAALAVKYVREHAAADNTDPRYVFISGFSAGGHLAACCGAMWNDPIVREAMGDAPEGINRPTATVLCYPVISGIQFTHRPSIDALCGYPSEGTPGAERYSMELHVDSTTPPAFIWHTFNDPAVPVQNPLMYAAELTKAGVPFELHIYPDGAHGLSLCTEETWANVPAMINPVCSGWIKEAIRYVKEFQV